MGSRMDCTNWKFGQVSINFLVIAIAYKGIALPIAWVNLDKEGNSKTSERKSILERILKLIPSQRIDEFAADREFIGEEWFISLLKHGINPVIRIKRNSVISHRGKTAPGWVFFNNLRDKDVGQLTRAKVMGIRVFVIGTLSISQLHSSILLLDHIHAPSGMVATKRRIPEFRVRYVVLTRIARLNLYQQNGIN